jgi:DNA polymerase-1
MLLNALEMFDPKYVMCDGYHISLHSDIQCMPNIRGKAKPTDLSLIDQFPLVEEILKSFNIPVLKREGYEADDILGTVSK